MGRWWATGQIVSAGHSFDRLDSQPIKGFAISEHYCLLFGFFDISYVRSEICKTSVIHTCVGIALSAPADCWRFLTFLNKTRSIPRLIGLSEKMIAIFTASNTK